MNRNIEILILTIFTILVFTCFALPIRYIITKSKEPTQDQLCQPKVGQRAIIDNIDGKLSCTIHQDPKSSHYTFNKRRTS